SGPRGDHIRCSFPVLDRGRALRQPRDRADVRCLAGFRRLYADAAPVSPEIRHWAASHPGTVRTQNQDSFICCPQIGLFSVADGVGGHLGGDLASARVVSMLGEIGADISPAERLAEVRARLRSAHTALLTEGQSRVPSATLATTVIVLMIHGDHFALLWA